MADDPLAVLSLAEGHTAINSPVSETTHDPELTQFITAISRVMDSQIGAVVQRVITDEIHDGDTWRIVTRQWPVTSFTSVTEDLHGTPTVLTAYEPEPFDRMAGRYSGRIERDSAPFPPGRWNVKVTYVAGRYATTAAVDPMFKAAAGSILRRLWKRESGTWAQSSDFFEGLDTQVTSGFYRSVRPMLEDLLAGELGRYSPERERRFGVA